MSNARRELIALCDFAGLSCPEPRLGKAAGQLRPEGAQPRRPLQFPRPVCEDFNLTLERYGFADRAVEAERARADDELQAA